MQDSGTIVKALSGFYYVDCGGGPVACRARGRFRHQGINPLVGDKVEITRLPDGSGMVDSLLPRRNAFTRPAVANIDQLIIIASASIPITDPFLIDRLTAMAEHCGVEPVICVNKCDLDYGDALVSLYRAAGLPTLRLSAETGEGMDALAAHIAGKLVCFTGNSGVGKSSVLNRLEPDLDIKIGEISERLGRGRHTTRHIELFRLKNGALCADTPGFSSFDTGMGGMRREELAAAFREFRPYLDECRFVGCAHVKEQGCAVLDAAAAGHIPASRHESYVRLCEELRQNSRN